MQDKDDLSDWLQEASAMNRVYLYSHCNISATVSLDGSQGLSRKRDLVDMHPPTIRLLKRRSIVDLENYHEVYQLGDTLFWDHNVARSPINTRGWVFQEMLLAPRVLHFSHDQLFWECRQHRACEVAPNGDVQLGRSESVSKFKSYLRGRAANLISLPSEHANDGTQSKADLYEVWQVLVQRYSATHLTNPLDKLIALSGIAKLMSTFIQGTYVAGMWRENLKRDLLWSKTDISTYGTPRKSPRNLYRAPTWSWASRDGVVEWMETGMQAQVLFDVKDVYLEHKTQDVTGHVTNGWLEVACKLGPITLSVSKDSNQMRRSDFWRIDYDSCTQPIVHFLVFPDELSTDSRNFDDDNSADRFFFMPCSVDRSMGYFMLAMVLRVVDSDNGVFERIGMAAGSRGGWEDEEEPILPTDIDEHVRATLPCLKYEDGLHTIRII